MNTQLHAVFSWACFPFSSNVLDASFKWRKLSVSWHAMLCALHCTAIYEQVLLFVLFVVCMPEKQHRTVQAESQWQQRWWARQCIEAASPLSNKSRLLQTDTDESISPPFISSSKAWQSRLCVLMYYCVCTIPIPTSFFLLVFDATFFPASPWICC